MKPLWKEGEREAVAELATRAHKRLTLAMSGGMDDDRLNELAKELWAVSNDLIAVHSLVAHAALQHRLNQPADAKTA